MNLKIKQVKLFHVKCFLVLLATIIIVACNNQRDDINKYSIVKSQLWNASFHQLMTDSLQSWIDDSLSVIRYIYNDNWQIDSAIIVNSDSTRLYSILLSAEANFPDATSDALYEMAGAKINGEWYFYLRNYTLILPREQYKYNVYEPLTFMQMSYLAHQEILSAGIRRLENGQYVTDEAFMERQFFDRDYIDKYYGGDRNNLDTMVLNFISGKYKYKLDTAEIAKIKKEMAESRRPYLPPQSWWDKTFNRKLFDE